MVPLRNDWICGGSAAQKLVELRTGDVVSDLLGSSSVRTFLMGTGGGCDRRESMYCTWEQKSSTAGVVATRVDSYEFEAGECISVMHGERWQRRDEAEECSRELRSLGELFLPLSE